MNPVLPFRLNFILMCYNKKPKLCFDFRHYRFGIWILGFEIYTVVSFLFDRTRMPRIERMLADLVRMVDQLLITYMTYMVTNRLII